MYYNNNEYSLPVVLCSNMDNGALSAMRLLRSRMTKPHVFSNKFSIFQRLLFKCHSIEPFSDESVFGTLVAFASELDEHYTPILILSDEVCGKMAERYTDELGAYFIIVNAEDFFEGESADDYS